jgi:hypothetical protein
LIIVTGTESVDFTGKLVSECRMIMDREYFSDAFYLFDFLDYLAIISQLHRLNSSERG